MRRIVWLGDSLDRLKGFPAAIQGKLGFGLYQAQIGEKHESAKMLHGFSERVWQIRADDATGTYRAVYFVQLQGAMYVLHTFQKKSVKGIATVNRDMNLIRQRLKLAREISKANGD